MNNLFCTARTFFIRTVIKLPLIKLLFSCENFHYVTDTADLSEDSEKERKKTEHEKSHIANRKNRRRRNYSFLLAWSMTNRFRSLHAEHTHWNEIKTNRSVRERTSE